MVYLFKCPNCNKEFDSDNPKCNVKYYHDDEDEDGNIKWDASVICPFCGYNFWEELWDED